MLGPDHPDTLAAVNDLGDLLGIKGDLEGAAALIRRALAGREKLLGPDHPDTLRSVANLGNQLRDKGDLEGAEALFRRALAGRETVLGAEHRDTLGSLRRLGYLLSSQDNHDDGPLLISSYVSRNASCRGALLYDWACVECLAGNVGSALNLIREHLTANPGQLDRAMKDDNIRPLWPALRERI